MNVLERISESGGYISWARHEALKAVVHAGSDAELDLAHDRVLCELTEKNIWVAIDEQGVMLSRDWPESPGVALVSFPDQGTALQVLEEIGAASFFAGLMSYANAIKSADVNNALLVMVTYDGTSPHYVPVSHLAVNKEVAIDKKAWWKFW
ncbi:hypothetical protein [Gimesia sp.]|uniref:hypothetical protein n=1 Tax=Gimesia sp. TaxID=2024833 RepID=UPI000C3E9F59|nr:hypothetical protein [Gimesia sp.]MAX37526.1 hypothetical protein [Gimesia sp.]HAH44606.1 hypothetical protein [Planctomycetaceae bacterium]|tara:strand:- start:183 stop:635 length:453 start_codon:yes stop_codon:yes gene_type:complete